MTDEELRRLKRSDLLELLIVQEKETDELRRRLQEAEAALQDRCIRLEKAGNLAEAALQINGVLQAAQAAGEQYLASIRKREEETEVRCAKMEEESRVRAEQRVAEAEEKARTLETKGQETYDQMVAQAEAETREFWDMVSRRLEAFYQEHAGLRELLSADHLKGVVPGNADG